MGVIATFSSANAAAQLSMVVDSEADRTATARSKESTGLPPLPGGTSTIMGGAIRDVDPVLDRFTLEIAGAKPMRILFDERTQIFLDGKRISLNQLQPSEHASVQTTLDGTSVFAISVHILSQLQVGDYQGEIVGYDPTTGNLDLVRGRGGDLIRIRVTSETKIERKGQSSFTLAQSGPSDLRQGALVSVEFEPDGRGRGSARHITLLAMPGSKFVFSGSLISLDMHTGSMILLDPRDNRSYQIAFNPGSISTIQNVHSGQRVRITAEYDGTQYVAQDVTPY